MSKKVPEIDFGQNVENALKKIIGIGGPARPQDQPVAVSEAPAHAEPAAPAAAPAAFAAPDGMLLTWYTAMKPRVMYKFIWLVLLNWQAARTKGVIVIDEFAALLGQTPEKVRTALNDLSKAGWIKTLHTEKGARGKIVSKTIEIAAKK